MFDRPTRIRLESVKEVGGIVTRTAHMNREVISEVETGLLTGSVWDSTRYAPLVGAEVYLSGTGHAATTDSVGAFLMDRLSEGPSSLAGALVFDNIVGTAAALLLVFGQVNELWTPVASVSALRVLAQHRVHFRVQELIPYVPNVAGTGPCPFEVMAGQKSPEQLYAHLAGAARHHRHTS